MHDCRADSASLKVEFGIRLANVFDTQVAHAVLEWQSKGTSIASSRDIGLNQLCQFYGMAGNPLKQYVKNCYRYDRRFWAKRPMTEEMIIYAAADVLCLVPDLYELLQR